jgi:hypothetical protein
MIGVACHVRVWMSVIEKAWTRWTRGCGNVCQSHNPYAIRFHPGLLLQQGTQLTSFEPNFLELTYQRKVLVLAAAEVEASGSLALENVIGPPHEGAAPALPRMGLRLRSEKIALPCMLPALASFKK